MEMKDRRAAEETLRHGDVRMPEITGLAAGGPSRARVMLHLAGMGLGFLLLLVGLLQLEHKYIIFCMYNIYL